MRPTPSTLARLVPVLLLLAGCTPTLTGAAEPPGPAVGETSATSVQRASTGTESSGSTGSDAPTPALLPAWTAPVKCPPPTQVRQTLGTGALSTTMFHKYPLCSYSTKTGDNFAFSLEPDGLITDARQRDPSSTFATARDLGADGLRIRLSTKLGKTQVRACALVVRLDRAHGANSNGDLITSLRVSVSAVTKSFDVPCAKAEVFLGSISRRVAFAGDFIRLPRYSVDCTLSAAKQGGALRKFLVTALGHDDGWTKIRTFEPLARPAVATLRQRCGEDYAVDTIGNLGVDDQATLDRLWAWLYPA